MISPGKDSAKENKRTFPCFITCCLQTGLLLLILKSWLGNWFLQSVQFFPGMRYTINQYAATRLSGVKLADRNLWRRRWKSDVLRGMVGVTYFPRENKGAPLLHDLYIQESKCLLWCIRKITCSISKMVHVTCFLTENKRVLWKKITIYMLRLKISHLMYQEDHLQE